MTAFSWPHFIQQKFSLITWKFNPWDSLNNLWILWLIYWLLSMICHKSLVGVLDGCCWMPSLISSEVFSFVMFWFHCYHPYHGCQIEIWFVNWRTQFQYRALYQIMNRNIQYQMKMALWKIINIQNISKIKEKWSFTKQSVH